MSHFFLVAFEARSAAFAFSAPQEKLLRFAESAVAASAAEPSADLAHRQRSSSPSCRRVCCRPSCRPRHRCLSPNCFSSSRCSICCCSRLVAVAGGVEPDQVPPVRGKTIMATRPPAIIPLDAIAIERLIAIHVGGCLCLPRKSRFFLLRLSLFSIHRLLPRGFPAHRCHPAAAASEASSVRRGGLKKMRRSLS